MTDGWEYTAKKSRTDATPVSRVITESVIAPPVEKRTGKLGRGTSVTLRTRDSTVPVDLSSRKIAGAVGNRSRSPPSHRKRKTPHEAGLLLRRDQWERLDSNQRRQSHL